MRDLTEWKVMDWMRNSKRVYAFEWKIRLEIKKNYVIYFPPSAKRSLCIGARTSLISMYAHRLRVIPTYVCRNPIKQTHIRRRPRIFIFYIQFENEIKTDPNKCPVTATRSLQRQQTPWRGWRRAEKEDCVKNIITISLCLICICKKSFYEQRRYTRVKEFRFPPPSTPVVGAQQSCCSQTTKKFVIIRQSKCDMLSYNNTCQWGSSSKKHGRPLSPARRFALASTSWRKCSTRYFVRIPWPATPSIEISSCRAIFTRSCFCGSSRRSPFLLVPFTRRSPLIRLIRICASLKTLSNYALENTNYTSPTFTAFIIVGFLPRIRTLTTFRRKSYIVVIVVFQTRFARW